jgi:hypothetical protein
MFQNRVSKRIFGPKGNEVTVDEIKLHYEELHNLYSPPNIMIKPRKMRWAGHVAQIGEKLNAYRPLMGKRKKRPLGTP